MEKYLDKSGATEYTQLDSKVRALHITPDPDSGEAKMILFADNTASPPVIHEALSEAGIKNEVLPANPIKLRVGINASQDFEKALDVLSEKGLIHEEAKQAIQEGLSASLSSAKSGAHPLPPPPVLNFTDGDVDSTFLEDMQISRSPREKITLGDSPRAMYMVKMAENNNEACDLLKAILHKEGDEGMYTILRFDDMNLRGTDLLIALEVSGGSIDKLLDVTAKGSKNFRQAINEHPDKIKGEPIVSGGASSIRSRAQSQNRSIGR